MRGSRPGSWLPTLRNFTSLWLFHATMSAKFWLHALKRALSCAWARGMKVQVERATSDRSDIGADRTADAAHRHMCSLTSWVPSP